MSRPRVLLADDHELLLAALVKLLEPRCEIVGVVTSGRRVVDAVAQFRPDLLLLDLSLPDISGLDAVRQVQAACKATRVIMLTMHEQPELAAEALRRGASAYVLKRSSAAELFDAIAAVLSGQRFVSVTLRDEVLSMLANGTAPDAGGLTERQRDILRLVADGHPMKKVADILGVSQKTVEYHKYQVMRHLKLKSTAELVRYAEREGLVSQAAPPASDRSHDS